MKNYKIKNASVQAEQYKRGMEDGFNSDAIGGNYCGYFPKDSRGFPKNILRPVINTKDGLIEIVEDDWIVLNSGEKLVYKEKDFFNYFENIDD